MTATADAPGTVHVDGVTLPYSDFASDAARAAFERVRRPKPEIAAAYAAGDIAAVRRLWDKHELLAAAARAKSLFPVDVTHAEFGGIGADVVTPADGISPANRDRVLINLHGGGFVAGAGAAALLEAVPIAGIGKIKVVTLDYRLSPEHVFPAASEDIAAAYRALLKDYRAENIGFYGCSAGGTLSAQAVAWLQKEGLPRPGAIAMICSNAARMGKGDSFTLGQTFGTAPPRLNNIRWYFDGSDPNDSLVSPCASPTVLAKFPPTLLVSASRDFFLSHTAHFHLQLVKAGVEARLCVWDGLWHGFVWTPELPESREAYDMVSNFFAQHLGRT